MQHLLLPLLSFAVSVHAQVPEVATPEIAAPGVLTPPPGLQRIRQADLLAHATFLADDELGGRLTGSPGQEAAAKYIAAHFEQLGLEPLGDEVEGGRSYFQRYGISRTHVLEKTRLTLGSLSLRKGFAVLGGRPVDVDLEGKMRFLGLGRTRGSSADVGEEESLGGQVAVVAIKGPRGRIRAPLSVEQKFGMSFQAFSTLGRTAKALEKKGAMAVLFVQLEDPAGLSDVLNYLAVAPGKDMLAANAPGADPGMGGLAGMLGGSSGAPALVLSVPASASLLTELAVDRAQLAAFLDGSGERPEAAADRRARVQLAVETDTAATACNVVAVQRGRDPALAAEAIVFSAHMDHIGRRIDGEIYNGADDNASGSAGLMAIAAAFAQEPEKPRRSVIFLSVSGEELGLWGSQHFVDHPTWDFDGVVADINTDMIGRSGPESGPMEVAVTPSNRHRMFSTLAQDAARFGEQLGVTFTSGDKYYERSDHFNFARKGVPVVFFCNGEHEDYHQVTDHADKLDGAKMERIARLAFWTGWNAANADDRPRKIGRRETWFGDGQGGR